MHIIADENIPQIVDALSGVGAVRLLPGRAITRAEVAGADALLVRSITPVNAALLEGTAVRFVGTATAGTDHVDTAFLASQGIAFVSAAGSNARSVFEYIAAALLELSVEHPLEGRTFGIVGHGRIGSLVETLAPLFGMRTLLCDPPKGRSLGAVSPYVSLQELLCAADIVTLHVPGIADGEDRTLGMISDEELALLPKGAVLLNTSRGDVLSGRALSAALRSGAVSAAVLDVWEGEPRVDAKLLAQVRIGTPHIAGYSSDGKLAGTRMVAEALRTWARLEAVEWNAQLPLPVEPVLSPPPNADAADALRAMVREAWNIRADDARMRDALSRDRGGGAFDALRKNYPTRREFAAFTVDSDDLTLREMAARLGFHLAR